MKDKVTDNKDMEFKNIDHETQRTYEYSDFSIRIERPLWLHVSKSGGHRVLDAAGVSHYIAPGWRHLYWEVDDGVHFRF